VAGSADLSGAAEAGPTAPCGRTVWLAAYAVATFLSFPHPVGGRVLDLGLVFGWLGPAFWLLGLRGLAPRRAAWAGLLASWVAHSAILHWIYVVTVVYGHAPIVVGWIAPMGLALYMASFGGLMAWAWAWLGRRGAATPIAFALLWVLAEHLRHFVFTGFPWATLGYAQHDNRLLLPWTAWTGVYGLSFVTALAGAAIASVFEAARGDGGGRRRAGWLLAGVALLHALGWMWAPVDGPDGPAIRMAAVQGNIDQGAKWSREWAEATLARYERLTREAVAAGARIVVWPETAIPFALELDRATRDRIGGLARETGAVLVVGSVGVSVDPEAGRVRDYYDSAFVVDATGRFVVRYDKSHLVPFGEFVPFRSLLGRFIGAVASGIASKDVAAGEGPAAVDIELPPGPDGSPRSLRVGLPICYELLFPDLVRRFVEDGAGALLAITNDAWYGRTGAPYQFLAITALRSAETGVYTLRAANTGVSAIIDGEGRVRDATPIFETGWVIGDVPLLPPGATRTFYARHGDVFVWLCWLAAAVISVRAGWGSRGAGIARSISKDETGRG